MKPVIIIVVIFAFACGLVTADEPVTKDCCKTICQALYECEIYPGGPTEYEIFECTYISAPFGPCEDCNINHPPNCWQVGSLGCFDRMVFCPGGGQP